MYPNLKVVGVVGYIGSGKDTIAKYISNKCSMKIFSIIDIAREIAQNEGLSATRENLQTITEKYYKKFGKTYFIRETIRRIKHSNENAVITGVRAPIDATTLRDHFHDNFILICVTASRRIRFQRLLKRNEPRDPKTWQEFLEQDQKEEEIFQLTETCRLADYRLTNNETVEKLYQKVDRIIEERLEV
jgi:dephospho-CoA kinase